jgi:hypothetical protein
MKLKLSQEDKGRIWRALASYVYECEELANYNEDPSLVSYFREEVKNAKDLRDLFNVNPFEM